MTLSTTHPDGPAPARGTPRTLLERARDGFARIPEAGVALLGRLSIAAVFWRSGQTKIEGFALDPAAGNFTLGWPRLSENALLLFEYEYAVPLLAPGTAALLATVAEHLFPLLLVLGLGTRWAALGLLAMTGVIQIFVYPGAWPTHGVWAAVLLWLLVRGAGALSLDHWLARRARR
ncbi:MAG: DoxX family protein [Pseudomonadales bacterium]|jgi:putative oxidoreductase|nr:DoxX family protein [Pseudomonadales bacterium]